jgi:hypothetical protein
MQPDNDLGRAGLRISSATSFRRKDRTKPPTRCAASSASPASTPRRASARCRSIPSDAPRPPSASAPRDLILADSLLEPLKRSVERLMDELGELSAPR